MLMYAKAAAAGAVALGIVECLRRRVIGERCFTQIVVGILDVDESWPFCSQKIEGDRINRHTIQRHEDAARPCIVKWSHLPFAHRRAIRILAPIEPVDKK